MKSTLTAIANRAASEDRESSLHASLPADGTSAQDVNMLALPGEEPPSPREIIKMKTYRAIATKLSTRLGELNPTLGACLVVSFVGLCLPATGWGENPWAPKFVTFDPPGSNGTFPTCVNDRGMVVGEALLAGDSYNVFIRNPKGDYTTFALPGTASSTPGFGINLQGAVAGSYLTSDFGGTYHGLLRTPNGNMTEIDVAGAGTGLYQGTTANNINDFGFIAGYYSDDNTVFHGFVRTPYGNITTFDGPGQTTASYHGVFLNTCGALNEVGEVVGYYLGSDNAYHSFLRSPNGAITSYQVAGSPATDAAAINVFGVTVGSYTDSSGVSHGFLRSRHGAMKSFDAPGAGTVSDSGTFPAAINAQGVVTGYYIDPDFVYHGFIRWPDGRIIGFEAPGAGSAPIEGTLPTSINAFGAITGSYVSTGLGESYVSHGFVLYP
jgi:hypothetical protein